MGNALSEYKLGQGCMGIGGEFTREVNNDVDYISALRLGVDLGLTFLDTAEVYGGGHSEELIGRAIRGIRSKVFIASKFSPENSSYKNVLEAAERSLTRLKTEYLDLYQVHWPNPKIPVCETMAALEKLVQDGKILNIGVSNFSKLQMIEAQQCLVTTKIISNQVEYNLFDRFIENDIYPHCMSNNSTLIAYSPLEKGSRRPRRHFSGSRSSHACISPALRSARIFLVLVQNSLTRVTSRLYSVFWYLTSIQ